MPKRERETTFAEGVSLSPASATLHDRELNTIGSYSYSWSGLPRGTVIGNYSSIAQDVKVMGVKHPLERFSTSAVTYDPAGSLFAAGLEGGAFKQVRNPHRHKPIIIEDDVWIGEGVLLSPGIRLGMGSVIAARSIVTKDVPAYAVVAGSPARMVKMRFDEKTVETLIASEWSRFDVKSLPITADSPIEVFLDALNQAKEAGTVFKFPPVAKFNALLMDLGVMPRPPAVVTEPSSGLQPSPEVDQLSLADDQRHQPVLASIESGAR